MFSEDEILSLLFLFDKEALFKVGAWYMLKVL